MKIKYLAILLLIAGAALAQDQPTASGKPDKTADKTTAEPAPLWFVQTAALIAINTQHLDLNGYAAAYIDQTLWTPLLKDNDAGPFLKLKEAKPGRKLVLLIADSRSQTTIGVFFDGASPNGLVVVKPGEKIAAGSLSDIPKDAMKETDQKLRFETGSLASDDGDPIPSFNVFADKKPN